MRKTLLGLGLSSLVLTLTPTASAEPPADGGWGLPPPAPPNAPAKPGPPAPAPSTAPGNPPGPAGPSAPPGPPPPAPPDARDPGPPRPGPAAPPPAPPRYAPPPPPPYDPSQCGPAGEPCAPVVRVAQVTGVHLHDGFFLRFGLPFSASRVKYTGRSTSTATTANANTPRPPDATIDGFGMGFDFALGGTPAQGLVLAGEMGGLVNSAPSTSPSQAAPAFKRLSYSHLGFLIDWYPNPRQGLHLLGGVGLSQLRITPKSSYTDAQYWPEHTDTDLLSGMYFSIGIGHEWWVSQQWSIGVLLKGEASSMKSSGDYESVSANASYTSTSLGVTFTYH